MEEDYHQTVEWMRQRFELCKAWPYCQYHGCGHCTASLTVGPNPDPLPQKGTNVVYLPLRAAQCSEG